MDLHETRYLGVFEVTNFESVWIIKKIFNLMRYSESKLQKQNLCENCFPELFYIAKYNS